MSKTFYDPLKIQKKFGRAMAAKGWNQSQLALHCGLSAAIVSRVLKGERGSVKTIAHIAYQLGVPLDSILAKEEETVA